MRTRPLVLVASAVLAAGCHSLVPTLPPDLQPAATWGRLAVVEEGPNMEALAEGIVRIDQTCVYLDAPRLKTVLVWPEERTRWVPPGGIEFERLDGARVKILNGDRYEVTGGFATPVEWVNRPDASCPETQWLVADVAQPQ